MVFARSEHHNFWLNMFEKSEVIALVDGSWLKARNQGGIGGVVRSRSQNSLLIFSGSARGCSSLEIEWEAVKFLVQVWRNSKLAAKHLLICSDSKSLVENYEDYKF